MKLPRRLELEFSILAAFWIIVLGLLLVGIHGCAGLSDHPRSGWQAKRAANEVSEDGWSGFAGPGPSDDRCRNLESRYQLWGAVSIASTALAGSGALTTPVPEDKGARFAIGISAASLIALGAAALFVRDDVLSLYAAECETSSVSEPRDP